MSYIALKQSAIIGLFVALAAIAFNLADGLSLYRSCCYAIGFYGLVMVIGAFAATASYYNR